MPLFRHLIAVLFLATTVVSHANSTNEHNFSRNFWYPTYNIQRLSYCSFCGKECGLAVANRYCKMMGYEKATKQIIDYNVGLTNYLSARAHWPKSGLFFL
jgi:hypothetical protein